MDKIGIVGAGAWGTALAIALRRAGRKPIIWAFEPDTAHAITIGHRNDAYLPGIDIPEDIEATTEFAKVAATDIVMLAVPAQNLRDICRLIKPHWRQDIPAVICAKGIETGTSALMNEVVAEELPKVDAAILSGPTFAIEVARGLPTAVTLACSDTVTGRHILEAIGSPTFRPYLSEDVVGVAVGGAVKNVLAIACGVVEGKALGDNARASLITRGLAELARLAVAKGGRAETCMGLSGLGDLVLTASSGQSRNYSLGVALGEGRKLQDILGERRSVAEGVPTAAAVLGLAARLKVELPVCAAVAGLLHRGVSIQDTIRALLARPFKSEVGTAINR